MSLWTPGGEHEVPPQREGADTGRPGGAAAPVGAPDIAATAAAAGVNLDELSPEERQRAEEMIAQMAEAQAQMLATPVEVIVANHVIGFYELAGLHLQQPEPDLRQARVAIDAMAAVVETLAGRLGENEPTLQQALQQAKMAFLSMQPPGDEDGPTG